MKQTKKDVIKKAAQAGVELKVNKAKGEVEITRKKKPESEQYNALMEAVKILVKQNAEMMAMNTKIMAVLAKSDNTKQIIEEVANVVAGKMNLDKSGVNEQMTMLLARSQMGRDLDIRVKTRDNEGFMETATVKIRPELLN